MSLPISRTQVDKLGDRLRHSPEPAADDLAMLQDVVRAHLPVLEHVASVVHEHLDVISTTRLKTVDTLIDKLTRERTRLSTIHDIAGVRLAAVADLTEQNDLGARVAALFDRAEVIDRRTSPSHGYRALHVVVSIDGLFVEVQIRTHGQDQWAQIVERLGDRWGRGIRYGSGPVDPDQRIVDGLDVTRRGLWSILELQSTIVQEYEDMSAEVQKIEAAARDLSAEDAAELSDRLSNLRQRLSTLRDNIAEGLTKLQRIAGEA